MQKSLYTLFNTLLLKKKSSIKKIRTDDLSSNY